MNETRTKQERNKNEPRTNHERNKNKTRTKQERTKNKHSPQDGPGVFATFANDGTEPSVGVQQIDGRVATHRQHVVVVKDVVLGTGRPKVAIFDGAVPVEHRKKG
jgi:hypothetical protein